MGKKHADRDDTNATDDLPAAQEAPADPSPLERFEATVRAHTPEALARVTERVETAPPLQVPTLGRIVLYSSAGEKGVPGELHAAVITGVDATTVALHVWTRTAEHNVAAAEQGTTPGTWAWPARV